MFQVEVLLCEHKLNLDILESDMPTFTGTAGTDFITGGAGDDTIDGLGGDDGLTDYQGNNTFVVGFGYGIDTVRTSYTGIQTVFASVGLYEIATVIDRVVDYSPLPEPGGPVRRVELIDGSIIGAYSPSFAGVLTNLRTNDLPSTPFVFSGVYPSSLANSTVTGTAANEIFGGSDYAQTINCGDGNDIAYGNGGSDTIYGGVGNDYISTGIEGTAANDFFYGGDGIDTISYSGMSGGVNLNLAAGIATGTTIGSDIVNGFEVAVGSLGNDVYVGTNSANTFTMSFGNDYVYGRDGNDLMFGGSGIDVLQGELGNDVLYGDYDQDYLFGGAGTDTYYGGEGVDVMIDYDADASTLYGGDGGDYFYTGVGADLAYGGAGNDIFVMSTPLGAGDTIYGGDGQDYFYMGDGADTLIGGAGVDVMLGGGGNDVFDGGADVDYLFLGAGGSDTVINRLGDTADVVYDFGAGDLVRLVGWGYSSFADVQSHTLDQGSYSIVYAADGTSSVWLIGITPGMMTAGMFAFS
jgi:Ca2+-binding RTX toxin-like protein